MAEIATPFSRRTRNDRGKGLRFFDGLRSFDKLRMSVKEEVDSSTGSE